MTLFLLLPNDMGNSTLAKAFFVILFLQFSNSLLGQQKDNDLAPHRNAVKFYPLSLLEFPYVGTIMGAYERRFFKNRYAVNTDIGFNPFPLAKNLGPFSDLRLRLDLRRYFIINNIDFFIAPEFRIRYNRNHIFNFSEGEFTDEIKKSRLILAGHLKIGIRTYFSGSKNKFFELFAGLGARQHILFFKSDTYLIRSPYTINRTGYIFGFSLGHCF